jgi:hypothetical protein
MVTRSTKPSAKVEQAEPIEEVKPYSKSDQVKGIKAKVKVKAKEEVKPVVPEPAPAAEPEPDESEADLHQSPPEPYPDIDTQLQEIEPLTLKNIVLAIGILRDELAKQGAVISMLAQELARKRKAVPNGKVQIKDTLTGKVYKSKNNAYKSLLASGELAELIKQGVFGPDPARNTFGWYALNRAFPGRFIEVKAEAPEQKA